MADIFNEVDEEVRRERLKAFWDRYSIFIVALAVLIVAGIGGWRAYEYYVGQKAAAAGATFEEAVTLSEQGKHAEAEKAFAKVVGEAPKGYAGLARLRAASELAQANPDKPEQAVNAYSAIAADGSLGPLWQDLATLRAGLLVVDTAPFADLRARLEPITAAGRPYRHTARELLALSAFRANDTAEARRYIDMITADAETPPGARQRIDVLSAIIAGEGKAAAEKPADDKKG
ncbi:MAG TPA: tetratricopeptide repeat protein [Pseudolabrys sp.]|nr:tetratricopeptide repeat protein [Pseudolabrys sp.]